MIDPAWIYLYIIIGEGLVIGALAAVGALKFWRAFVAVFIWPLLLATATAAVIRDRMRRTP